MQLLSPISQLFFTPPLSLHHHHHHHHLPFTSFKPPLTITRSTTPSALHLQLEEDNVGDSGTSSFDLSAERDMRRLQSPPLEVKELEELPEQWRRSKIAWLCKELPPHKPATMARILNGQKKWITQEDVTYVALHCMRIRENEAGYRVYKWMAQNRWYRFDFALVTKLADYLGKDRKFTKCRELFDAIINQGQVPSESTFHILIVAYLSAPVEGCLEEACSIYNRMIQVGGYRPRLSLHNSLFRALTSKTGSVAKQYLKQAEFIYHNLVTSDLEVHKDVYAGLIWLHSYQDVVDRERIASLREEMRHKRIDEDRGVLVSVMRASSKEGDLEETERTWLKLLASGGNLPSQAFVYRMDVYAKAGEPMKSLEIFRTMKGPETTLTVAAYHKIIELMSKAHEIDIAEKLLSEFVENGMKPLTPAFRDIIHMYNDLEMHDKLELAFAKCLASCHPDRSIYNVYLESLVRTGNLGKAEEIFNEMYANGTIGATARSCNAILGGFLASDESDKAERVYDIMRQKKYDVEPPHTEKLQHIFSMKRKVVQRRVSMKLDQEQREILTGMLLGGVRIESDEARRNHAIHFEFTENSEVHAALKTHIHERFYEWLASSCRLPDDNSEVPSRFYTVAHSYFAFFYDQFRTQGRATIPKVIHRWLSQRVLAYWYMYGGFRTSAGDILLKLKAGNREDVVKVAESLQAKSLACKVKRKGRVFWIGLQGSNAVLFWKMIEPYVLENIRDHLMPTTDTAAGEKEQEYELDTDSDRDVQES
ncbi:pentatricopeptide repeat-containing protein OTP51, chloroplastic [Iris pallida]|uniref:Pentatricopeptide repeat-containing protein OTP51, chloroplastic n=1 Tax=Iris pallida TaxID=29817 RepID=A0AAX6FXP3_IRIPA|nr:pentatricopeptide repeat-containing protein OTP51, chloroplastic [Iris pallida]